MEFCKFEKKLMQMLLVGKSATLQQLRKQYLSSVVVSREITSVGFFTTFSIQGEVDMLEGNKTFQIGDVDGKINSTDEAVGFILYIRNGVISTLEGYTNIMDQWPKDAEKIELKYDSGKRRDFKKLEQKMK